MSLPALVHAQLPKTLTLIEEGIRQGLQLGAQLYISVDGHCLADWAAGQANERSPMSMETLTLWLSSAKPLTAVVIAQLCEEDRLGWDDPVAKFVPAFSQGSKEQITIRHLLTHTAGIRSAGKCDLGHDWGEIIACICNTPLDHDWIPGRRAGYDPSAGWYMLGEIVRFLDQRPLEDAVRKRIFEPCGMKDSWLALPVAQFRAYGERIGLMYHTEKANASPHLRWNSEADASVCRPGRSGRGPIRELGRFYEHLLGWNVEGGRALVHPATLSALTVRERAGLFDDTFQHVLDWGLGFCLNSNRHGRETVPYGYGQFASEQAFGHSGAQSSCAFVDPAHRLVVAWLLNGLPGERRHQQRARELNSVIYQDLGLA